MVFLLKQILTDSWAVLVSKNFIFYLWAITLIIEILSIEHVSMKWILFTSVVFSVYLVVMMSRSYFSVRKYFDAKVKLTLIFALLELVLTASTIYVNTFVSSISTQTPTFLGDISSIVFSVVSFLTSVITPLGIAVIILWSILRCDALDIKQPSLSLGKIIVGDKDALYSFGLIVVIHLIITPFFSSTIIETPMFIAWIARHALQMPPKLKKKKRSENLQEIRV